MLVIPAKAGIQTRFRCDSTGKLDATTLDVGVETTAFLSKHSPAAIRNFLNIREG
ncbi:hypothetical protein [Sphingomonas sp. 1P08PE]|uniref:hypothetical protein n=1 Tax=Sphingomonas sp. 1P08PE TaxID=554122 RepID=UPI0039A07985